MIVISKFATVNEIGVGSVSEPELWDLFRAGEKKAYQQIYDLFSRDLMLYGNRITTDRQLIKDTLQDLFLSIWENRSRLSPTTSIKFYLYRALRNRIVRSSKKLWGNTADLTDIASELVVIQSPEDELLEREDEIAISIKLKAAIATLTNREREVVQLRFYHNFSFEQISDIMNINNQSTRNLAHTAISKLRKQFHVLLVFISSISLFLKEIRD